MSTDTVPTLPRRRPGFLVAAFFAATLIAAVATDPAFAQRRCEEDAAITGRTCSVATCLSLQAAVKSPSACGDRAVPGSAPTSCNGISGCSALQAMRTRWIACGNARDKINAVCWRGGDPGHTQASIQAWQNVSNCNVRIALPEPVGCADPCPLSASGPTSGSLGAAVAAGDPLEAWLAADEPWFAAP